MMARRRLSVGDVSIRAVTAGCIAVGTILLAGCGSSAGSGSAAESHTPPTAAAPRGKPIDPRHPVVEIATNQGAIRIRLDAVNAPGTVRNFINYVDEGFYAGTLIHYVAAGKLIVGGGYTVEGQLKPAGMPVRNEAHNGLKNVRGTLAMARDVAIGIDSASSQYFINLADSPSFDHRGESLDEYGYCVFGEVVSGLEVADLISQAPTQDRGGDLAQTPVPPIVVTSISIVE